MVRKGFWKSDWFLGVIIALVGILLSQTDCKRRSDLASTASKRTVFCYMAHEGSYTWARIGKSCA